MVRMDLRRLDDRGQELGETDFANPAVDDLVGDG